MYSGREGPQKFGNWRNKSIFEDGKTLKEWEIGKRKLPCAR
jgi:hypothetical protein